MTLSLMPAGPFRRVGRLRQIAQALRRHGFGSIIYRLSLGQLFPWTQRLARTPTFDSEAEMETVIGQRLVAVMEDLGPTFVKLGQILSSRPDLLPPTLILQLRRLHDRVAPFDSVRAHAVIEQDFGRPPAELFAHIDAEPFASGSIAQAYHATTRDGQQVVVKVKRPNIEQTVRSDVGILRWLADRIEAYMPELRSHNPRFLVDEFWRAVSREMDMVAEAAMTERFHRMFAQETRVVVPRVRWDLTGSRVLTITHVKGLPFHEALSQHAAALDRPALAKRLIDAFLKQFFDEGVFHADPHPGNLLIDPPDGVSLVDFGMVGHLDETHSLLLALGVTAAVNREYEVVIDILSELNAVDQDAEGGMLVRDLNELVEKYYGMPLKRMNVQQIFLEITDLARQHRIRLPRDYVLLGRSMVALGGCALELDPDLNIAELIVPRLRALLAKRVGPASVQRDLRLMGYHYAHLVRETPGQIREILRRGLRGQLQMNISIEELERTTNEIDRSSNRLSFSVVIAAIVIGSSLVIHSRTEPQILGISALGLAGFVVAGIMGLWLVVAIFRSGKMS